jgi:tRNA 2-thiouridine synthesizing protein A
MEKRLGQLTAGAQITVLATDAMARIDIPLYCRQHGHDCSLTQEGEVLRFVIVKKRDIEPSKG